LASQPSEKAQLAARATLADAAWLQMPHSDAGLVDLMGAGKGKPAVEEARRRLEELAALQKRQLPPDDPALVQTRQRLLRCAALAGDTDTVLTSLTQLIGEYRESGNTAAELRALQDRAALLTTAGRSTQAVDANAELLHRLENVRGASDQSLLPVLQPQYGLLRSLHRKKEARAIKKRLRRLERALNRR
jgi:hypothetical protein